MLVDFLRRHGKRLAFMSGLLAIVLSLVAVMMLVGHRLAYHVGSEEAFKNHLRLLVITGGVLVVAFGLIVVVVWLGRHIGGGGR